MQGGDSYRQQDVMLHKPRRRRSMEHTDTNRLLARMTLPYVNNDNSNNDYEMSETQAAGALLAAALETLELYESEISALWEASN